MAIDRIDWHAYGDFPDDLPPENGGYTYRILFDLDY